MGKVQVGEIGVSPDEIATEVESYLTDNPPTAGEPLLAAHIISPTPHPAYDDNMNLDIYFENGLA